jgi:glycosyltransferase involved in cell wall biosynthesis
MSEEETNGSPVAEQGVRPVIVTDATTLRDRDAFLRHCLVGLADESCKGILLCPPDIPVGQVEAAPVEIVTYPPLMALGPWKLIISPLVEQLQRLEPTVLHGVSESKLALTRRLSDLMGIPFIASINSPDRKLWSRCCKGNCQAVVTPSESLARQIRKDLPALADRVRYIRVGAFVSEKLACFSGTGDLVTMVMIHPLRDHRDFEPAFNAIKHLSIDGMEMVVALMGSGKAEGKVRRLIMDLGLGHVINIVPEVRPVRQVFAGADVFIKPVRSGAFDFFVLDAMSEGLAVTACKGDDTELLRDGQTAALFNEGDELSIYSTLGSLLKERQYARGLAAAGQELIRSERRVSRMVTELITAYREVSLKGR